jgi:hypothetical protein
MALYAMLLMWENPVLGQVGGDWALEIKTFLGPVKQHRTVRPVPCGAQKADLPASKALRMGLYKL